MFILKTNIFFFFLREIQVSDTQADQLNIFETNESATKACYQIQEHYPRPTGIKVFFKYSIADDLKDADKSIYPYTQELFLGQICCEKNYLNPLFAYGNSECGVWGPDQIG